MTPKQITLVQESWQKILPIAPQVAETFYTTLFELDDNLKTLFSNGISDQGDKLIAQLDVIVKLLNSPEKLLPKVQKLGERHINYGVEAAHYNTFKNALLKTLETNLGKEFTQPVKRAWTAVYKVLATTMLDAANKTNSSIKAHLLIQPQTEFQDIIPSTIKREESNMDTKSIAQTDKKLASQLEDALEQLKAKELESLDMSAQLEAVSKVQATIEFEMDGTIITANDNFLNCVGYRLEELQGKHHSLFVEPSFQQSNEYKEFWDKLNRGEFESKEYKRIGKGGKEVWLQASYNPILDLNGKPYKVVKFATDMTEQKLMQADFSGQIEAISKAQAVIEFNMDGTVITANDNFLNCIGYRLDEVQGQHHRMFVDAEYKASNEYHEFWAKLNRGEYDAQEYKRIGKGGKEVWLQASYNPIFDLNGKPFKVVKYATDITARKFAIAEIKNLLVAMAEGDLTQYIEGKLVGEFGIIGDSMNELIKILSDMVGGIRLASTNVFDSAREIAEGNNELSQRTESQASSLEETASAMEELTSTVQQNAENTTDASKLSASVMDKANNGGDVVKNAIAAMSDINKSSKKIADIISVIDEIAFQTNLLALNAAVEAARAGEQGRGFAVVAAEVRNLAQRSAGAAKEIKGLINDSVDAVGLGTKFVDQTGQTFNELVDAITEVSTMIADIDNAGKEQSAGIGEVSAAVTQMDEMTQQNAALVEEAAASSKSMEDQAQVLLDQVSFFSRGDQPVVEVKTVRNKTLTQRPHKELKRPTVRTAVRQKISSDQEWEEF